MSTVTGTHERNKNMFDINEITFYMLPTQGHKLLENDLIEFSNLVHSTNDLETFDILVSAAKAITHNTDEIWVGIDWCNKIECRDTSNPEGRKYIKRNLKIEDPNFYIREGYSTKNFTDDQVPSDMRYESHSYSSIDKSSKLMRRKPNHLKLKNNVIFDFVKKMFKNSIEQGEIIIPKTLLKDQKQFKLSLLPADDIRVLLFLALKKIDTNFKNCELETFIQSANSYRIYGPNFNTAKDKLDKFVELDLCAAFPTAIIAKSNSELKAEIPSNGSDLRDQIISEVEQTLEQSNKDRYHLYRVSNLHSLIKSWTLLTCMNANMCSSLFDNTTEGYINSNKFSLMLKSISPTAAKFTSVCHSYQKDIQIVGEKIGTTCHRELSKVEAQAMLVIADYMNDNNITGRYSFDGFKLTLENSLKVDIKELQQLVQEKTGVNFTLKLKNGQIEEQPKERTIEELCEILDQLAA